MRFFWWRFPVFLSAASFYGISQAKAAPGFEQACPVQPTERHLHSPFSKGLPAISVFEKIKKACHVEARKFILKTCHPWIADANSHQSRAGRVAYCACLISVLAEMSQGFESLALQKTPTHAIANSDSICRGLFGYILLLLSDPLFKIPTAIIPERYFLQICIIDKSFTHDHKNIKKVG